MIRSCGKNGAGPSRHGNISALNLDDDFESVCPAIRLSSDGTMKDELRNTRVPPESLHCMSDAQEEVPVASFV